MPSKPPARGRAAPITDQLLVKGFRQVKQLDRAYRRIHRHPILHAIISAGRSWVLFFFIGIPLITGAVWLVRDLQTQYLLLTGMPGGSAASLGEDIVRTLNRPTYWEQFFHLNLVPDFTAVGSCGSLDNLVELNKGHAQLAMVEDGLPIHSEQAPCPFRQQPEAQTAKKPAEHGSRVRAMLPLYLSPLHVLAKKRLAIKDVRQLPLHSRVYLGPDGSATNYVSGLVLEHYAIAVERVGRDWDIARALQELQRGTIDAAFFVITLNSDNIQEVMKGSDVVLLNLDGAKGIKLLAPYLEVIVIPAETYKGSTQDITTLGTRTILAASTDLSMAEVYEMATKLAPHLHRILRRIPLSELKMVGIPDLYYRLHEGAIRYFTHDPPFFLNPHFAAGLGSYLSVIYVSHTALMQLLRRYRIHRLLSVVDRLVVTSQLDDGKLSGRFYRYERVLRRKAAQLLRRHRIKLDDFTLISEYLKSQVPTP